MTSKAMTEGFVPCRMASGALMDSIVTWVWLMSVQLCMAQTLTLPLRLRPVIGNTEILDRDGSSNGVLA